VLRVFCFPHVRLLHMREKPLTKQNNAKLSIDSGTSQIQKSRAIEKNMTLAVTSSDLYSPQGALITYER
jgi:hypothetical protein